MALDLSKREYAQLLAALRNWQEEAKSVALDDLFEAYFENVEPLSADEIDSLCDRIAIASMQTKE